MIWYSFLNIHSSIRYIYIYVDLHCLTWSCDASVHSWCQCSQASVFKIYCGSIVVVLLLMIRIEQTRTENMDKLSPRIFSGLVCCRMIIPQQLRAFFLMFYTWYERSYLLASLCDHTWHKILMQVHHGGAGTTAAGLKAAVVKLPFLGNFQWSFGFYLIYPFIIYFNHVAVPNNCGTFLWGPTLLGRSGTCQRCRACPYPRWRVLTWKVGCCNKVYARSRGNIEFVDLITTLILLHDIVHMRDGMSKSFLLPLPY